MDAFELKCFKISCSKTAYLNCIISGDVQSGVTLVRTKAQEISQRESSDTLALYLVRMLRLRRMLCGKS